MPSQHVTTLFRANVEQLLAEANRRKHTGLKEAIAQCVSNQYEVPSLLRALIVGCDALRQTKLCLLCIGDIGKLAAMRMMPHPASTSIPLAAQTLQKMFDPIDEDLQLKLVQSLVALVSASDPREAYIAQPLSAIFSLFSVSRFAIVQAACSATITQTSHQLLSAFRNDANGGGDASHNGSPSASTTRVGGGGSGASDTSSPASAHQQGQSLGAQLLAASYYKDVCAMCAGLTPKWLRLDAVTQPAQPPTGPSTAAPSQPERPPAATGGSAHAPSSNAAAVVVPTALKHLLLDVLTQHITESKEITPETHSPLLVQCLNEHLVTLVLTCPADAVGGGHGASASANSAAFHELSDLFSRVQRLAVAALVHARRCMRHTAPAVVNHHTMLVLDAAAQPWKMAILLSLWRKHLSDFHTLDHMLDMGRDEPSHRGTPSTSRGVSPNHLEDDGGPTGRNDDENGSDAAPGHPRPLVLLVQAAASLLNHIITASCGGTPSGGNAHTGGDAEGTELVVSSLASPDRVALTSSAAILNSPKPSHHHEGRNTQQQQQPPHSALTTNGSFSTLSSATEIIDLADAAAHGVVGGGGSSNDFQSNVTVTFPTGGGGGGRQSNQSHPAAEFVGTVLEFITMVAQSLARSLDAHHAAAVAEGATSARRRSSSNGDDRGTAPVAVVSGVDRATATHAAVLGILCPRLLQCCSLAMRHLVGEDIVHSVLKCTTHLLHCCCVLRMEAQRDAFLAVLAQQVLGAQQVTAAARPHGNSAHSRGNSPTQQPPPVAQQGLSSASVTKDHHGSLSPNHHHPHSDPSTTGSTTTTPHSRHIAPPPPLRANSTTSMPTASGTAGGRSAAVREFLSKSEWIERRVHVLSAIISIASAMGARLGTGWHIVVQCFLAYSELVDEVPKLRRLAALSGAGPSMHANPASTAGPTTGGTTAAGSGSSTTLAGGWVGLMSQGASNLFYGSGGGATSANVAHSDLGASGSGSAFGGSTGRDDGGPPPHHHSGAAGAAGVGGAGMGAAELQSVLDSLAPLHDAIQHVFAASYALPDEALQHLARATTDGAVLHNAKTGGGGVATHDAAWCARAAFASHCLATLLHAQCRTQELQGRIGRLLANMVRRFYHALLLATPSTTDAQQPPSPSRVCDDQQTLHAPSASAEFLVPVIDDLGRIAVALLSDPPPSSPPLQASEGLGNASLVRPTGGIDETTRLMPLTLLEECYVRLAAPCGSNAAAGRSIGSGVPSPSSTQATHTLRTLYNIALEGGAKAVLPSGGWCILLRLLGHSTTGAGGEDVTLAFRCLESIQHSHLQSLDAQALGALIASGGRFMVQRAAQDKMSVNLSAVQLLWSVGDFLVGEATPAAGGAGSPRVPSTSNLVEHGSGQDAVVVGLWGQLIDALRDGCLDVRQEIRHAAVKSLFSLVVTHGSTMSHALWAPFLATTLRGLMDVVRSAVQLRGVRLHSPVSSPNTEDEHSSSSGGEFYSLTPNKKRDGSAAAPSFGNCEPHSHAPQVLAAYLAKHPRQLDETRVLLLEFVSRLFRMHYRSMVAEPTHHRSSSGAPHANHHHVPSHALASEGGGGGGSSGPSSFASTQGGGGSRSSSTSHRGGSSSAPTAVMRERLEEFLALCATIQTDTWGTTALSSTERRHDNGLPEEVGMGTVKAVHAVASELLPNGILEPSDVETMWSVLEALALSSSASGGAAPHVTHSALVLSSKVLALVVESLGDLMLTAVRARATLLTTTSSQQQPPGSGSSNPVGSGSGAQRPLWYPTQFISLYLQRLVGVWDACSQSTAARVCYFYPSPVQTSVLNIATAFVHGPLGDAEWHTVCGFLVGQVPSRSTIEAHVLARRTSEGGRDGATTAATDMPPLGVHLNYVQRVAQLLFEAVLVCPPSVASWLTPLVVRPLGCLILLAIGAPSTQSTSSYRTGTPAGFFDNIMHMIESLCWGVIFQRSASQRSVTAAPPSEPSSPIDVGTPPVASGPASPSLAHQSAPKATQELFANDVAKRRDYLHSYMSMLNSTIGVLEHLYAPAPPGGSNDDGAAAASVHTEGLEHIEVLVRWVGELIQDCVCLHDAHGASELLAALVPASSLAPPPLRRISRTACVVMNLWAEDPNTPSRTGPPSAAAAAPSTVPSRVVAHRRTESTMQRLEEASESIASLQTIARATMGSRNRAIVESFLADPSHDGNRELLISTLKAMGATTSAQRLVPPPQEELAALRAMLPSLLRLIPVEDLALRLLLVDALQYILELLGVTQ